MRKYDLGDYVVVSTGDLSHVTKGDRKVHSSIFIKRMDRFKGVGDAICEIMEYEGRTIYCLSDSQLWFEQEHLCQPNSMTDEWQIDAHLDMTAVL